MNLILILIFHSKDQYFPSWFTLTSFQCAAKTPGDAELWHVHLAARPQVNFRSVGRKRFAHLSESQEEIQVEENVPWGEDTLFTLEFREEANKYAIHTCNNMYLNRDGKLTPEVSRVRHDFCSWASRRGD